MSVGGKSVMTAVVFQGVSKRYSGSVLALEDLNLRIAEGEFLGILGASGSGKTTLLRLIAGLEEPTSGTILVHGQPGSRLAPHQRGVALVSQQAVPLSAPQCATELAVRTS